MLSVAYRDGTSNDCYSVNDAPAVHSRCNTISPSRIFMFLVPLCCSTSSPLISKQGSLAVADSTTALSPVLCLFSPSLLHSTSQCPRNLPPPACPSATRRAQTLSPSVLMYICHPLFPLLLLSFSLSLSFLCSNSLHPALREREKRDQLIPFHLSLSFQPITEHGV